MKRIVASIGAAAIGSTALPQAQAANLSPQESTKPWSASVALRGFYDDNYLIAPRDTNGERDSFGLEVRPSIGINMPLEQTYLGLDVTYSGRWYEDRSDNPWDHSVMVNGIVNHSFTELVNLEVRDQFVYSDRPELTDPTFATIRTDTSAINNRANVQFSTQISPRLGFVLAYQNLLWDYENDNDLAEAFPPIFSSLSARLDRMEHLIPINLRHQTGPSTVTILGYSFGAVDYTSNEYLYFYPLAGALGPKADSRNYRSHYGYVGVEHNFTPLLSLGVTGGAQYSDFYNSPTTQSTTTPYGNISLTYLYTTGSQLEVGYSLSQAATDQIAYDSTGNPTLNRLVSSLYGRVDHQILPQLHGGLYAQWQYSEFNGGAYDGDTENLYLFGASLRYQFNRFLSADLGYKFDYMDSDLYNRGYTRNQVHLGLTATY